MLVSFAPRYSARQPVPSSNPPPFSLPNPILRLQAHQGDGEAQRKVLEPMFYAAGVDAVFAG